MLPTIDALPWPIDAVLNPTIQMSWIWKNWDNEYVVQATETIKDLVLFCGILLSQLLC